MDPEQNEEPQGFDPFADAGISDADFDDAPEVLDAPEALADEPDPVEDEPASEGPERDENGRFKAKSAEPEAEPAEAEASEPEDDDKSQSDPAPTRFSSDAKAEWDKAPLSVRREAQRAVSEMQAGLDRYRETVEPLKQFIDMAGGSGEKLAGALQSYVGIEQTLRTDPLKGLGQICENLGTDLRSVAAKVLGQEAPKADETAAAMRREIASLREQLGGVTQNVQQTQRQLKAQDVAAWASTKPRFDELTSVEQYSIQAFVQKGYGLDEAYEMADRLNPAPATAAQPQTAQPAQTRRANLSVTGAPAGGSNPPAKRPSSENSADLRSIFDEIGI